MQPSSRYLPTSLPTYCINLARRTDRWARLNDACALVPQIDLRRLEAVDSRSIGPNQLDHWISPTAGDPSYLRQPSRLAVWLSHRHAWEKVAHATNEELALVLEDDAVFVTDFFSRLEESLFRILPRGSSTSAVFFDVAILGPYNVLRSLTGALVSFEGTQAYLLSRSGALRLLSLSTPGSLAAALDWALAQWSASNLVSLYVVPHLVRQQYTLMGSDVSHYRSTNSASTEAHSAPYIAPTLLQVADTISKCIAAAVIPSLATSCPSLMPRIEDLALCAGDLVFSVSALNSAVPASDAHQLLLRKRAREFLELTHDQAALCYLHALVAQDSIRPPGVDFAASLESIVTKLASVLQPPPPVLVAGGLVLTVIEGSTGSSKSLLYWDAATVAKMFGELTVDRLTWQFSGAGGAARQKLQGEPLYLLLCFSSAGEWHEYHDAFNALRAAQPTGRLWPTAELPEAMRNNKGLLALVEWRSGVVMAARQLAMPQGVYVDLRTMLVGRRLNHDVLSLGVASRTSVPHRFSHPQMANIHTIERCPYVTDNEVYLLSSADSDSLFEVNGSGEVLWRWHGADHGYIPPTPLPEDCRPYTFHSLAHALHPNSATYFTRNRLLVTFFHIHKLAFVDRDTGAVTLLPLSLSYPHAIRPARSQPLSSNVVFSVCNTRGGEVVLLDHEVQEIRRVRLKACQWIQVLSRNWCCAEVLNADGTQDAIVSGNSAFVSCNLDVKRRQPGDHNRLVEVDVNTGKSLRTIMLSPHAHLYSSYVLSPAEASVWYHAWQAEDQSDHNLEEAQQQLFFIAEKAWKLDLRNLVALFLHGSRVRGLNTTASDWDFVAVVAGDALLEQHYQFAPSRIDLTVLSTATFVSEVRAHNLWRLACLFSPPAFILKMDQSLLLAFSLDRGQLLRAAVCHSLLHYNKAARAYAIAESTEEGLKGAKKKIFHALLLLAWAEDVALNGRVTDQRSANFHWDMLQADTESVTWQTLHERWRAVVLQGLTRVATLCGGSLANVAPLQPLPAFYCASAEECLSMLAEIKSAGAASLCARLSIPLVTHCEYRELQQCGGGGLIVQATTCKPVCAPIWRADAAAAPESGIFRMYYYDSQWKIACLRRPDTLSDADLQLSLQRTPYLALWSAWREAPHVVYQEGSSYCFTLTGGVLRLLSITNSATMTRHEAPRAQ